MFALMIYADSCLAQTSTQRAFSDPQATYAAIKSVMRKMQGDFGKRPWVTDEGVYYLNQCGDLRAKQHLMRTKRPYEDKDLFESLGGLASNVLTWTSDLTGLRYPRHIWEPLVAKFESEYLAGAIGNYGRGRNEAKKPKGGQDTFEFIQELERRLAAHRKSNPSLVKVIAIDGCGDGEVVVKIVTDPRGGQVLFIPTFFYELCRAQNLNPEDTTRCNRWRQAEDGQLHDVIGNYQYIAKWRDGTIKKGMLRFGQREDGKTITVRQ
jgi:hypothetical protein